MALGALNVAQVLAVPRCDTLVYRFARLGAGPQGIDFSGGPHSFTAGSMAADPKQVRANTIAITYSLGNNNRDAVWASTSNSLDVITCLSLVRGATRPRFVFTRHRQVLRGCYIVRMRLADGVYRQKILIP